MSRGENFPPRNFAQSRGWWTCSGEGTTENMNLASQKFILCLTKNIPRCACACVGPLSFQADQQTAKLQTDAAPHSRAPPIISSLVFQTTDRNWLAGPAVTLFCPDELVNHPTCVVKLWHRPTKDSAQIALKLRPGHCFSAIANPNLFLPRLPHQLSGLREDNVAPVRGQVDVVTVCLETTPSYASEWEFIQQIYWFLINKKT